MPAVDLYTPNSSRQNDAGVVFAITPHATDELVYTTRQIRANAAGTIRCYCVLPDGTRMTTYTDANFAAGEARAIRVYRVTVTGTTATGIEGIA